MVEAILLNPGEHDTPPRLIDVLAELRQDFARGLSLEVFIKRLIARSEPEILYGERLLGVPVIITRTDDGKILIGTSYYQDRSRPPITLKAIARLDPTFKNLIVIGRFQENGRVLTDREITDCMTGETIDRETKAREFVEALPFVNQE